MRADLIITTDEARDGFYPTPPSVAKKMLADLDFRMIRTVLEPSAGKGDLAKAYVRACYEHDRYGHADRNVDCVEIDPYLRQVLKYELSEEKEDELREKIRPLDQMLSTSRTKNQNAELARLRDELHMIQHAHIQIVHDDFFTYRTFKHYDLILMNPPFASGDLHLLRAIEMQKQGGSIVCLLNAETLRNPYTQTRQLLARRLQELGADVQFLDDAFSTDAERKARADVAIIRIHIDTPEEEESDIWQRMKKAVEEEDVPDKELHALVSGDYIDQAIQLYRTEVAATMELVREYRRLCPHMTRELSPKGSFEKNPILSLTVLDDSYIHGFDLNKYMRAVRMKYWEALFTNPQFTGRLTSELQKRYRAMVERMAAYEFSAFNIKQIVVEMNASMIQGVEEAILDLFEKLTVQHSWYPECSANRHYFNGWATNKAHKIGKKCIIPTYGMFSSYSSRNTFSEFTALEVLGDIEKAFDYLSAKPAHDYNLQSILAWANSVGKTRNIELKYFKVDLFKKGTTHIKFYPESMPLVERLNIYASQKKGWLPPRYGKASYANMEADEKAVVDSFHGDGAEGSGQQGYETVLQNAAFYLAEPTRQVPALMAAVE